MLRRLLIRDFVIVDRLELDFAAGFGALTGETGAGKSILVDALLLVLGERADASIVRVGAARAEIAAEFDATAELAAWLAANDFSADEGVLLRRVVDAGGRSRGYVNGMAATLAQLKEAAELLAEIHGQHAHLSLLRPDAQRRLVDERANATELAQQTRNAFHTWRQIARAREDAARDAQSIARERELLQFQVSELAALNFDLAHWSDENAEHQRLSHAAGLIEGVDWALGALVEADTSASGVLTQAVSRLNQLVDHDAALQAPVDLLEGARIQLGEAAHALARYRERLEIDPARLTELDARIDAVLNAARKHRISEDELPQRLAEMRARLTELERIADPQALAENEAAALAAWRALAERLTAARVTAASEFSRQVSAAMQDLAMSGGRFEAALVALDAPAANGAEEVEFRVAPNSGQPLRPLAKSASGGELSRIGLAIQVIASQASSAATLVFDEIDVGIGGGVAEIVGRLLRQLGQTRQVLCVTHLPQVAAQANWQWAVVKRLHDGVTLSAVTALEDEARVDEIARMLGGVTITATTRDHAREMLKGQNCLSNLQDRQKP